jgi:hypothetical protein
MPAWHGQGELYMYAGPFVKSINNVDAVQGCQQFRIVMHAVNPLAPEFSFKSYHTLYLKCE